MPDRPDKNPKNFSAAQLLAARPTELHKGAAGAKASDSLDIEKMIEDCGCSREYYALEECLGEHDRDWTKCQGVVKQLKLCNERRRAPAEH